MIEKLRQLKKKSQMTNQQIAEKSNLPESTVARIFSGKTPNPTVTTVISMARAMGGSPADILSDEDGMNSNDDPESTDDGNKDPALSKYGENEYPSQNNDFSGNDTSHEKLYEDVINAYKTAIRKKDKWILRLFWCLAIIVLFIIIILIFDITHPTFGFVKH